MKQLDITSLVVWDIVLPASEKDANPFKGQGTYGGMMVLAAFALHLIEGFCPDTLVPGMSGKLMKRPAQEDRHREARGLPSS